MNINHHLDDATLVSYSAGALSQGMALVVASHLSVCPQCRQRAELNDAVGGALLESLESESIADDMLASILTQLDDLPLAPHSAVYDLSHKTIDPEQSLRPGGSQRSGEHRVCRYIETGQIRLRDASDRWPSPCKAPLPAAMSRPKK